MDSDSRAALDVAFAAPAPPPHRLALPRSQGSGDWCRQRVWGRETGELGARGVVEKFGDCFSFFSKRIFACSQAVDGICRLGVYKCRREGLISQARELKRIVQSTGGTEEPLTTVATAVKDEGVLGLKEGTGIDCSPSRSEDWSRTGKGKRGVGALWVGT